MRALCHRYEKKSNCVKFQLDSQQNHQFYNLIIREMFYDPAVYYYTFSAAIKIKFMTLRKTNLLHIPNSDLPDKTSKFCIVSFGVCCKTMSSQMLAHTWIYNKQNIFFYLLFFYIFIALSSLRLYCTDSHT